MYEAKLCLELLENALIVLSVLQATQRFSVVVTVNFVNARGHYRPGSCIRFEKGAKFALVWLDLGADPVKLSYHVLMVADRFAGDAQPFSIHPSVYST